MKQTFFFLFSFFMLFVCVQAAVLMKQTFAHSSGSTLVRVQVSYVYFVSV
jgi:hypothetical protein